MTDKKRIFRKKTGLEQKNEIRLEIYLQKYCPKTKASDKSDKKTQTAGNLLFPWAVQDFAWKSLRPFIVVDYQLAVD